MDFKDRPQILEHLSKSVNITVYDTKWIPCSARFVALGAHARGTGALQIYEMQQTELKLVKEVEKQQAIKCGSFGASSLVDRHLATGDFGGKLCIYDLERPEAALFNVQVNPHIHTYIYIYNTPLFIPPTDKKKARRGSPLESQIVKLCPNFQISAQFRNPPPHIGPRIYRERHGCYRRA